MRGAVERSLDLSLADLKRFRKRTLSVTLECAGNGRASMDPRPPGTPWRFGAAGTARFTGVPLRTVLERARPRPVAVEVMFEGADRGAAEPGRTLPFARSLPADVAFGDEPLLAWAMNGRPLTREHGFPLRLIVPRWYGVASVKWLRRITVLSRAFGGYYQRERYTYAGEPGTSEDAPVTRMRVRAVIARPTEGARLRSGPHWVAGAAWSGFGSIREVAVSADGGRSWSSAELRKPASPYGAMPWRFRWVPPKPGAYTLMARATDGAGNVQPLTSLTNTYGYGNNVVHRIRVRVVR